MFPTHAFPITWTSQRATLTASCLCLLFSLFAFLSGALLWTIATGIVASSNVTFRDLAALFLFIALQILFLAPLVLFLREIMVSYWLAKFGSVAQAKVIWSLHIKGGCHIQVQVPWNGSTLSLWLTNGFYAPTAPCKQQDPLEIYVIPSSRNSSRIRWAMAVHGIPFKRK